MTRWPAMLKLKTAAQYCDLSEAAFVREVASGRLPPAVMFGQREHWHRGALDKALAILAGEYEDEAERDFWNRGKAA